MNKQHFTETQIPEGAFLGILGGGVPPGSPNPDLISDQKMSFFTPIFRPGLLEIMSSLLRLQQEQEIFLKIHSNWHISFSFFLIWN